MVRFRRSKNLKDHVRSKLRREEETVVGMFKCGKKKCKICDNVIIGATFKSHVEGGLSALTIALIVTRRV